MLPLAGSGALHPTEPMPLQRMHPLPVLPPHPLLVFPALLPVVLPVWQSSCYRAARSGRCGAQQNSLIDPGQHTAAADAATIHLVIGGTSAKLVAGPAHHNAIASAASTTADPGVVVDPARHFTGIGLFSEPTRIENTCDYGRVRQRTFDHRRGGLA